MVEHLASNERRVLLVINLKHTLAPKMDRTPEQPLTASKVFNGRDDDGKDNETVEASDKPPPLSDAVEATVGVAATLDAASDGNEEAPPAGAALKTVANSNPNDSVEYDDPNIFVDSTSPQVDENDLLVGTTKQMVATLKMAPKGKRIEDLLLDRPNAVGGESTRDMKDHPSWTALNFLIGTGLVQEQEPQTIDIGEEDCDKVVIWWEFAREGGKKPAVASIPAASETRLKEEISQLVREETMLDIWLSRLRRMQYDQLTTPTAISQKTALSSKNDSSSRTTGSSDNTGHTLFDVSQQWLYVTPSDVFNVVDTKKKGSASSFVAAVKAPVGSTVQVSTPVETNVIDLEGKKGSHQVLISSSGTAGEEYNVDNSTRIMGMTSSASQVQALAVKRNYDNQKKNEEQKAISPMNFPLTKKRKEPVEIYLLDRKRDRMQRLSEDFMLGLIEAPDYSLARPAANDIFHTSCLREDEGVSSFF